MKKVPFFADGHVLQELFVINRFYQALSLAKLKRLIFSTLTSMHYYEITSYIYYIIGHRFLRCFAGLLKVEFSTTGRLFHEPQKPSSLS